MRGADARRGRNAAQVTESCPRFYIRGYSEGRSLLFSLGASDGEIDQLLAMKEAFVEIVSLSFQYDDFDQIPRSRGLVAALKLGGVFLQGNDGIDVTMDQPHRDAGAGEHFHAFDGIEFRISRGERFRL